MAKLLPPYIDKTCKSSGEKQIFEILQKSSFTKDWIILHSLNLSQHTVRLYGEIDFLLLIPQAGIYVMEVKGGDVRCHDGVWYFTDRYGNTNKNKSPFNQARDAMFSLKQAIEKEFGKGHKYTRILSGFFCAFPHISFDKHSVEYESWQIMDKDSVYAGTEVFFKRLIQETIRKHQTQRWFSPEESLPDINDLKVICDFLRGDFERIRPTQDRLIEFNNSAKKYTEEQYLILDSILLNSRSLIQGSAGTGKTMIAIESAIRAASEGKKVLLVCYNRFIGEWIKVQVKDWAENIVASSIHNLLFELSDGFDYDNRFGNESEFYDRYLPRLIKDMFSKGIHSKFDKLIIDEGQDLIREEYLALFDAMLTEGLINGEWEIYGDFERQAIYAQLPKNDMLTLLKTKGPFSNFLLKINCRNTRQIGEETSLMSGFEKPPFLLEHLLGIPVEYLFYKDDVDQNKKMIELLRKLLKEGIYPNDLTILSPKEFDHACVRTITEVSVKELREVLMKPSTTDTDYHFATIHSYKGLENNYIVITDIEHLSDEQARSLLYIGMSRARYGLILLISDSVRNEYEDILKRNFK